jgi:beta-mannosidase
MVFQYLHNHWQFRKIGDATWLPATIPGTVHTDLLANQRIEDPFFRLNEQTQQWIEREDWEYYTTFTLAATDIQANQINLFFEGLDTHAEIHLNDVLLGNTDNMHRSWAFSVKKHLKIGENELHIRFNSAYKYGLQQYTPLAYTIPVSDNDQGKPKVSVFSRKAGYHFGWDWGPRFVTCGVWRPISLCGWSTAKLENAFFKLKKLTPDKAIYRLHIDCLTDFSGKLTLKVWNKTDNLLYISEDFKVSDSFNHVAFDLIIENPKLWWSNGLGEAHLYDFQIQLIHNSKVIDNQDFKIGVRTIEVIKKPDQDGNSFYFELNGVPVFMKGANYIPQDSFLPRVTLEQTKKLIADAKNCNMNMLRIWGGGVYESDDFYNICDESGILIWQDFMFACAMFPNDDNFLENVRLEAFEQVRRLRNHACLALWCGNNEILEAWNNWGWQITLSAKGKKENWEAYQRIFYDILADIVKIHDGNHFYLPSSPSSNHKELSNFKSGDVHFWEVWHAESPFEAYKSKIGRFMSEYGFQSFPDFTTVQQYTQREDWSIDSPVMKSHQRHPRGNELIRIYMERDYKVPSDFKKFLYVGQLLQAEAIKTAIEAHRRAMPYCMGTLYWQMNDCWGVASWSGRDYYGKWKAMQYAVKKAMSPILVSPVLEFHNLHVYIVSDILLQKDVILKTQVIDFQGNILFINTQTIEVEANSSHIYFNIDESELFKNISRRESVIYTTLHSVAGEFLSENYLYAKPVKELNLPPSTPTWHIERTTENGFEIAIFSNVLAKNVSLFLDNEAFFEDNYFDLLPNQTKKTHVITTKTSDFLKKNLRIMNYEL